jgi:processive 1,2-diacylglycerol beta-glucosyltransferase
LYIERGNFLKDLIRSRRKRYFVKMARITSFLYAFLLALLPLSVFGEEKKNILILCSNGGFGHNAAAQTLKKLIGDDYNITIVYPIDQLRIWGVKSGEQFYNMMLQHDWIQPLNLISRHIAPKLFRTRKAQMENIIAKHIQKTNPDLVISLIPFINFPASEAARKVDIPFLLITTDNDLQLWVHGLQGVRHPYFRVTVGSNLWCGREKLRKRNIPDSAIETTGLPIRTDFLTEKDKESIKNEFGIPKTKPVVLVMVGGAGGEKALEYAKRIGSTQLGIHLVVCAGKNNKLARDLEKIALHPTNTMTIMKFTTKIADLMAVADLLITKSGPGTINEALAMRIPILIDTTSTILTWEKANIDLVMQYGVGDYVEDFNELEPLLRRFLFDTELQKEVRDSYQKVPANQFKESIVPLISSMCKLKEKPL